MNMSDPAPGETGRTPGHESLANAGWGTAEPLQNPFDSSPQTTPWFRRPVALISAVSVAVVIVIGLVIAGVAANEDGTASDAEDRPTGTTSAASGELTYAETQFLRGVSPLVKRYATDEEILRQADYICSELESGDTSDIQTALVVTATQWATWTGGEAPTRDGSSYSFSEELATDALGFMLDTEDAFCPGAFPDLSGVAS